MPAKEKRKILKSGWYPVYKDYDAERLKNCLAYIIEKHPNHKERIRVLHFLVNQNQQ